MRLRSAILLLGLMTALPAAALDFRSVAESALLFDAPSQQGKPLYAIARGTPVEVVVALDTWVKVRDPKGDLTWIERRLLSDKRTVMVKVDRAQVRVQPEETAAVVFDADRDVVIDFLEPGPTGWAKVRHRDGQQGYVKALQVWGL
jgi:SH3-like domain-containing protein